MICNKDCNKCKQLKIRTDNKGYPFGYECMKCGDSIELKSFESAKEFKNFIDRLGLHAPEEVACELSVPLRVDAACGDDWYAAKG